VRALFELEVPEIADGIIEIRRIEREPGYRTKLAVHSSDPKVDCVGACVGVRGTRIKSIIDELYGERIDIIKWNEDPAVLIANALKPAEIAHIQLDEKTRKALVLVDEDQLSLGIGRKGQNVRLASKLTGWEIDILTRAELEQSVADYEAADAAETGAAGDATHAEPAAQQETSDSADPVAAAADDRTDGAYTSDDAGAEQAVDGTSRQELP
jgi:N utilization substance protein A